jgi:hypothetical protein
LLLKREHLQRELGAKIERFRLILKIYIGLKLLRCAAYHYRLRIAR